MAEPAPTREQDPQTGYRAASDLSLLYVPRTVSVHRLLGSELDSIASGGASIPLTLLGFSFGTFITLAVTVLTVDIPDPKKYACFFAMTLLSGFLSICFIVGAVRAYLKSKNALAQVKSGSTAAREN